ncbi:MAG TPA: hypothetical protein VF460_03315 [Burkholderiales bacterium]
MQRKIRRRSAGPHLMAAACAALLVLGACSVLKPRPVTPISEVAGACKSGASQAIGLLHRAKTSYALRGSDFGKLADAGCQPEVLDELQQMFYNDVDLLTRYWVTGESLGGCDSCYPQPVDLSSLETGGTGMGDGSNLGRPLDYSRPAGLPAWVTAYPGPVRGPAITVEQAAQMLKEGKSADEVAAIIETSRVHEYLDLAGITHISTHFKPALTGSALAHRRKEGMPDPVLDALQRKHLAEFIEFLRVRYQNWGKGSFPN